MYKQRGATFWGWLATAAMAVFLLVTAVKIAPAFIEFNSVKSLVEDIASDTVTVKKGRMAIMRKVDDYLNINGLYTIQKDYFSIQPVDGKKNVFALTVNYQVRKPWLANIDFLIDFNHAAELKRE